MRMLCRAARWLLTMALACAAGILPSCASMGGGGMHYVTPSPAQMSASS